MPRAKSLDSKPKGRMSAYAFFVQARREEHKRQHPDENVVFSEFSRDCADKWKVIDEKEKQRFYDLADKDKTRYYSEMSDYQGPKGTRGGRRRRQKKDPNAPKRALSAFFWFCNDERPRAKNLYPNMGIGEMAKELAHRWSTLSQEEKLRYEEMAKKDKNRYLEEMKTFKSRPLAYKQETHSATPPPPPPQNNMMNVVANSNFASNSGFQPSVNYGQNLGPPTQMNYANYMNFSAAAAAAAYPAANMHYNPNVLSQQQQQQQQHLQSANLMYGGSQHDAHLDDEDDDDDDDDDSTE